LSEVVNELDKDVNANSISGESSVKVPGGKTKTYDELLIWWEAQTLVTSND
jgi:hypothetical protein